MLPPTLRSIGLVLAAVLVGAALTSCSLPWHKDAGTGASVFGMEVGQCFQAPTDVTVQIGKLTKVDCAKPHDRELYAQVVYDDSASSDYPGDDKIAQWAQAACAEKFSGYVGVSYLDSALYFTYLAPSARSWQDKDRTALCFITNSGEPLTSSVKGTAK